MNILSLYLVFALAMGTSLLAQGTVEFRAELWGPNYPGIEGQRHWTDAAFTLQGSSLSGSTEFDACCYENFVRLEHIGGRLIADADIIEVLGNGTQTTPFGRVRATWSPITLS